MPKLVILLLLLQTQTGPGDTGAGPAAEVSLEQLYEQAMASVSASEWDNAIAGFNAILDADPSHIPSRFYLAVSFAGNGQPDRAIDVYRDILSEDESIFEARMNLGALLFENGSPEAAVDEFAAAMILAPENPTPALYRAQVLNGMGQIDAAIDGYHAVLDRAEPDGEDATEAYRRLGGLYLQAERWDRALEMLTEAVRLGVEDAAVFVMLGDLHSEAGELENAKDFYEEAMALDSGHRDTRIRLALLLRDMDLPDDAIVLLEGMNGLDGLLADSYLAAGRHGDAVPIYERLTADEPENAAYWQGLGQSYFEAGEFDEAVAPLQRAIVLDGQRDEALATLAWVYYQREDWVNAGTLLLDYLDLQPNHAASIFLLATCFDKLRDYEQALVHYNRFIQLDDGTDDARSFQVQQRARSLERLLEDQ